MASLAGSAARGAAITVLGQLLRLLIQLVSLVVLARLLSPRDFGLVAMVMAIVGVGEIIRDVGLSNASIQARLLTTQQRSNLFWLSSILGLLIGLIIAGLSPLIASFYGQSAIAGIVLAVALTFPLNGLAAQPKASLARALKFRMLAIVETAGPLAGAVAAITAASLGAGYWALVAQQIIQALVSLILSVSAARWLPGLPRRAEGMKPLILYGTHLLGGQLVAYFSRNIDTVVLGQRFGAVSTGYYSRAYELVMNPLNQINAPSSKVAIPILSKLQDEPERFDAFLLRGQRTLMALTVPFLALAIALAEPLVVVLLGAEWKPVAPFLQLLAIAAMLRAAGYATYWVALSRGFTNVSFYVNLASAPLFAACILLGSLLGPLGVAMGFVVATAGGLAISLIWYSKAAAAPGGKLFRNIVVTIIGTVPAIAASWAVATFPTANTPWLSLLCGVLAFAAVFSLTIVAVPLYRREARDVAAVARMIRRRAEP